MLLRMALLAGWMTVLAVGCASVPEGGGSATDLPYRYIEEGEWPYIALVDKARSKARAFVNRVPRNDAQRVRQLEENARLRREDYCESYGIGVNAYRDRRKAGR